MASKLWICLELQKHKKNFNFTIDEKKIPPTKLLHLKSCIDIEREDVIDLEFGDKKQVCQFKKNRNIRIHKKE